MRRLTVVESLDTNFEKGTGLGLAIVSRIVKNMNGQLRAISEEGRGSTFALQLNLPIPNEEQLQALHQEAPSDSIPFARAVTPTLEPNIPPFDGKAVETERLSINTGELEHGVAAPIELTDVRTIHEQRGLSVLVAEDDPINRDILQKRLQLDGCQVILAKDGVEAVDVFSKSRCDMILMDIQVSISLALLMKMPLLDGMSATRKIREYEILQRPQNSLPFSHRQNNGRVPIFAVSASLLESQAKELLEAQFDGWILKPINFRRLHHLLEGLWDHEKRKNEVYSPHTKGKWNDGGWLVRSFDVLNTD